MMKIRFFGLTPYSDTLQSMQEFTQTRTSETPDELWILEHPPVFTLGRHADPSHLLQTDQNIPLIKTDRGGQITYHGPGQLIIYFLLDLKRLKIGPKKLVCQIEKSVIKLLNQYQISAQTICNRPGIYIGSKKIASLGLRITRGFCYHGLSLNIQMDLSPFKLINPCGYKNLEMTQMADYLNSSQIAGLKIKNLGEEYVALFKINLPL